MASRSLCTTILLGLLAVVVCGCGYLPQPLAGSQDALAGSQVTQAPCTGAFVPHALDFTTTVRGEPVRMFDSNGAGVAVDDLDNDGDLDIVLANLGGANAVLWNEGGLSFRKQDFPYGDSHAVVIVDVDGDGGQDVVFSNRLGAPIWWRNQTQTSDVSRDIRSLELADRFVHEPLPGVHAPAYALAWGDLDQDGDLDLVTGSYDAELEQTLKDSFLFSGGAGVFYYENRGGTFAPQRLAGEAQTLTIALFDVNGDGWLDILAGNDFAVQDQVWLHGADGWQAVQPFAATTHSTMSFAAADIDNDGSEELFATDMKPYADDPQTLAAWQPVMDGMHHAMLAGDPQIMENVLQVRQPDGSYRNQAAVWGVDATGWSWSSAFGDLDNDGNLDLYVVNGMAAAELFNHLPANELVEENQVFRNQGGRSLEPMPDWNLAAKEGGRGMTMADLDNDGDLDIVVNNLLAPAMIYENQLCTGPALEVDLRWPDSANTRGLGARLVLHTSQGSLTRAVQASHGYASGAPARIHFGFPASATLERLDIVWPDGAMSSIASPPPSMLLTITHD